MLSPKNRVSKNSSELHRNYISDILCQAEYALESGFPILFKQKIERIPIQKKIIDFQSSKKLTIEERSEYFLHFFEDKEYLKIKENPRKYFSYFRQFSGLLGFDFNVYEFMPSCLQKYQIFTNLSLCYCYALWTIPVIPNISFGSLKYFVEFLSALPKNIPISISIKNLQDNNIKEEKYIDIFTKIIVEINPVYFVVYGETSKEFFKDFDCKFIFFK